MKVFFKSLFDPRAVPTKLILGPVVDWRLRLRGRTFLQQRLALDGQLGEVAVDDGGGLSSARHGRGDEAIEAVAQFAQPRSRQIQLFAAQGRQRLILIPPLLRVVLAVANEEEVPRRRRCFGGGRKLVSWLVGPSIYSIQLL